QALPSRSTAGRQRLHVVDHFEQSAAGGARINGLGHRPGAGTASKTPELSGVRHARTIFPIVPPSRGTRRSKATSSTVTAGTEPIQSRWSCPPRTRHPTTTPADLPGAARRGHLRRGGPLAARLHSLDGGS